MKQVVCRSGLAVSGHANNGAQAGSFIAQTNNTPSNTNANYSSQLCFEENVLCIDLAHIAKKDSQKRHWYRKGR